MSDTPPYRKRLLTVEDMAELRGSSVASIYTARGRNQLPPAVRVGKRLLWRAEDVEKWLATRLEHDTGA